MAAIVILSFLFMFGIAFNLLFLIALCKECRRQQVCYWVRLRVDLDESGIPADHESEIQKPRAA